MKKTKKETKKPKCKAVKVLGKAAGIAALAYAGLFLVYYLDLDGKLLYKFVEPTLVKHYDKMERRDPMSRPYGAEPTGE